MKEMILKSLRFLLLCLSPLVCLLPPYLAGWGIISSGQAFIVSVASLFILPFIVSTVIIVLGHSKRLPSVAIFVVTLLLQFVFIFSFAPPLARWEIMGLAHRLKGEFPPDELRNCSEEIRKKEQDGTLLRRGTADRDDSPWSTVSTSIDDSQLPSNFRGKFRSVRIWQSEGEDGMKIWPSKDNVEVVFELGRDYGIICGTTQPGRVFLRYPMAVGVYAYKYVRP